MHEKIKNIKDYSTKIKDFTGTPEGDVIPISWYRDSVEYDLVCICCGHRWTAAFPAELTEKPQWMGKLECRHPDCSTKGFVVKS